MIRERCGWLVDRVFGRMLIASLGALLVAFAAQTSVPMRPVPMTLQTAMMFLFAMLFGARIGGLSACIYLLLAWAGAPVLSGWRSFADSGLLPAKTAGYVLGFLPAALLLGTLSSRGLLPSPTLRMLALFAAHIVVLAIGGLWLSAHIGFAKAWQHGIAPFWVGALCKSVAVALLVTAIARLTSGNRPR